MRYLIHITGRMNSRRKKYCINTYVKYGKNMIDIKCLKEQLFDP